MRHLFLIFIIFFSASVALATTQEWNVSKSTHFVVYYKNAPKDFINKVTQKAEDYYNKIADSLGFTRFNFWLWDKRAKIYIYDNQAEYQEATHQPPWSYGSSLMGAKVKEIQSFSYEEAFFERILPHEMGHIIFKEFVGFQNPGVPCWLDEGVASYQEASRIESAYRVVSEAIRKDKFMDVPALSDFDPSAEMDSEIVGIFYAEAVCLVDFLIKEFSRDKFVLFCQNLRDKKDFRRALASVYPFSDIQELGRAWQEYLRNE
jgi:hypothetical protein